MEIARIQISGVKAKVLTKKIITAGMIGAEVYIEYTDPAWDKLNKTVVFNGNVIKDVIKPGVIVPVPPETIASPSRHLYVGVYGTDTNNNTAIPTLWADLGEVHTAADPSGDSSTNPSLPVYAQLLELKTGPVGPEGPKGDSYVLTDDDIEEIAERAAEMVDVPGSGGGGDLTGYAKETWVQQNYQPKGNYLTEVPEGYAKSSEIPKKPEDIGALPNTTKIPSKTSELTNDSKFASEEFVTNKIAEAELGGGEVDLGGYLQKSELTTTIDAALAQAKASGEFDGEDGVDGKDGKDGYTPVKGVDYFDGQPGTDGVSPTVSVSKSGTVTTVTMTDKNGTKTAKINDGTNGSVGKDGTSVTVKSVSESTTDGGSNVVTFSDGKTLTVKNGKTGSQGPQGPAGTVGKSNITITLAAGSWSSLTQTVTASGVTSSNTVIVSPSSGSHNAYCEAGVYCSGQTSGKLTFKCNEKPAVALTVNVLIIS